MSDLDTRVMLIVASLFIVSAIAIFIASTRSKNREIFQEIWQLYRVEFALVSIVLFPIYFGGILLLLACLTLTWRGQWELYRAYNKPAFGTIQWASYLGSALAIIIVFFSIKDEPSIDLAIFSAILIIFLASLLPSKQDNPIPIAFTGLALPVLPILFLIALANNEQGFLWLFFIYLVVELNDSFAYLTGKIFGKHHPFPYLSPRKSTEGLIGGLVIAGICGIALASMLLDLDFSTAAGATAVIILSGLLGDFATSALKRKLGIKDFPPIHGFHGGALDIHDAYLFAVPSFYLYYSWFIR